MRPSKSAATARNRAVPKVVWRGETVRTAAERRTHAVELYERALLAHDRARNCLVRAHNLLRRSNRFVYEEPITPHLAPMLDWMP